MYDVILIIYYNASNPAKKHASCTASFILGLQWGHNIVATLRLTNQRRKHRILRTTIGLSQCCWRFVRVVCSNMFLLVPIYSITYKMERVRANRKCCRFVRVAMPQHAAICSNTLHSIIYVIL